MTRPSDDRSLSLFCDFENIALGVRDAKYADFDIRPVLERLLVKGSIVVKKAYCDWERYKSYKRSMHEAAFELIDIPHVRQSGKNSADIRMVVDALDLCYTKSHVDTFVIISGDSDFSPLVSKLRENAKTVIGVGVKNSTSDLLISNCDEFIYYDDLVRERERKKQKQKPARKRRKKTAPAHEDAPTVDDTQDGEAQDSGTPAEDLPESIEASEDDEQARAEDLAQEGLEVLLETALALDAERGDSDKLWGSMVKQTLKRRRPGFNESYYGFESFGRMLEEAESRGMMRLEHDDRSGGYIIRSIGR